ncbi:OprO/OprP family phosphate-selective porin [Sphingobium sufflavum]|uniref:porin n=1 Tax=Sphingobium sufflavum TaxID=1129547 RepID=UPI001F244139|nr:porin [Sphingobium sufflavum]MCE7796179.1 OprO/OprP family phosphate-selective porin [Sphingobium sufflavum]
MQKIATLLAGTTALFAPSLAMAQTVADLQSQINQLKAEIQALRSAQAPQAAIPPATLAPSPLASSTTAPAATAGGTPAAPTKPVVMAEAKKKAWYDRLQLRGYTQMRYNGLLSGDDVAPAGRSRLRSVHDGSITENSAFTLRRARLILQGNVTDNVALYFQTDFASAVNAQSNGERREHFGQLRDAYVDVFLDRDHEFKLRFGQSKVPFGWENLQSSSNRLTLDRSDAVNSAVPSERDLGIVAFYTPTRVQKVWDRLARDGQKLFGNYGAFGVAVYNGQGVNRPEQNKGLMKVAMATWPFELDGLGGAFKGQVFELGGSAMLNKVRPEIRAGGVTPIDFTDDRYGVHAMLYPQPFGFQAEWNWGRAPQYDNSRLAIRSTKAQGGYVQAMYNVGDVGLGKIIPYGRWQHYRGGWKASTNAPRLETEEIELGVEWQVSSALEFTVAYANMKRREADERRFGQAKGDLIRTQVQFNY